MHCGLLEEPDMESTESWIERCLNESESKRYSSHTSLGNMSNDENEEKENNRASKPHSTPATLEWLEDNYEIAEGVCIPRSALYMHYLDFSEKHDMQPVNAASFGKIIRQQFPALTTRRLGTRANQSPKFSAALWQGMPPHMLPVLGSPTVVNIVGVCDSILYKAISGVLMPTVLQALPDSLTQVIRKFAKQLDEWLKIALHDLPENLRNIKFECKFVHLLLSNHKALSLYTQLILFLSTFAVSRRFSQILKRQTSLNHLCQASRTVINSADITFQMLEDWRNVDLNSITKQTLYTMEDSQDEHRQLIIHLYQEFDRLLEEQSPIEAYIDWLDSMVDRCVVKVALKRPGCLKKVAQQFLLMWSCFEGQASASRKLQRRVIHKEPPCDGVFRKTGIQTGRGCPRVAPRRCIQAVCNGLEQAELHGGSTSSSTHTVTHLEIGKRKTVHTQSVKFPESESQQLKGCDIFRDTTQR
ncbi:hypothetical protein WMY93_023078 [Mugilogobius chulae]|uniref:RFX-type winged-helix domain-containing protein n=1 Tax=Mugilogobius chulae TaxID=88201 RepID=A0AAW0ND96_9GOBI